MDGYLTNSVDFQCIRQARQAHFKGSFRGFLAPTTSGAGAIRDAAVSLESLVRYRNRQLPVVNSKGETLFHSWKSIFEENEETGRRMADIYSFSGKNVMRDDSTWPEKLIWHGSSPWGETSHRSHNCHGWSTQNPASFGLASSLKSGLLLEQRKIPCNHELIVLCIETGDSHTLYSS